MTKRTNQARHMTKRTGQAGHAQTELKGQEKGGKIAGKGRILPCGAPYRVGPDEMM